MPKKNDNIVGESEGPAVGGGHQTPEQERIVRQEGGGISDAERRAMERNEASRDGRRDPAIGGSSQGRSDQVAAHGPAESRKVAGGLSDVERRHAADRPGEKRR
jgi:hypothetical protein